MCKCKFEVYGLQFSNRTFSSISIIYFLKQFNPQNLHKFNRWWGVGLISLQKRYLLPFVETDDAEALYSVHPFNNDNMPFKCVKHSLGKIVIILSR